jgi:DNA-binding NarL/FixJ family response regulator
VGRVLRSGPLRVVLAGPPGDRRLALRESVHAGHAAVVSAEAADGAAALRIALEQRPELCLVLADPKFDWPEVVEALVQQAPHVAVVLSGTPPDDDTLLHAVAVGACGYLPADLDASRLATALLDVVSGRLAFPRQLGTLLIARLREEAGTS